MPRRGCERVSGYGHDACGFGSDKAYAAVAVSQGRGSATDRTALNGASAACLALRHWPVRFRGVSTRRLANYLAWCQWPLDVFVFTVG